MPALSGSRLCHAGGLPAALPIVLREPPIAIVRSLRWLLHFSELEVKIHFILQ